MNSPRRPSGPPTGNRPGRSTGSTGSAVSRLPRALGTDGLVALEDRVVGPVRRGARRAGVGAGRMAGWAAIVVGFFNMLGGALLAMLATGFLDTLGIIFLVLGALATVFGGGLLFLMARWARRGDEREIEGQLRRALAHQGSADAVTLAQRLGLPVAAVEAHARQLARRGEIDRDVDTERGVEIYRPLGWVGTTGDETFDRPEHHAERYALDDFDRALDNADGSGQSRAETAPAADLPQRSTLAAADGPDTDAALLLSTRDPATDEVGQGEEEEAVVELAAAPRRSP